MPEKPLLISVTPSAVVKILLVLAGAWLLYALRDVVLVVLVAIVIASAIEPGVAALARRGIPRILSVVLFYLALFTAFIVLFVFFLPSLVDDLAGFIAALPGYLHAFASSDALDPYLRIFGMTVPDAISTNDLIARIGDTIGGGGLLGGTVSTAAGIFSGLVSLLLVVVFSFYLAVIETGVEDVLRVIVSDKHEKYVLGLWRRAQKKIGLWMQGQLLLGVIMGVLVYLGLTILGVKHALVLAVVAALFELIPVFGPTLAAVPATAIAFVDGGFTLGIMVIALYVIFQQFENHLIYPLVVTKVVGVPPLLVILALIIGAKLAGFMGILLSVPAAATIQELVRDLQAHRLAHRE